VAQWIALQARARKISEQEFRDLAEAKQKQVQGVFDRVLAFTMGGPPATHPIATLVPAGSEVAKSGEGTGTDPVGKGGGVEEKEKELQELVLVASEVSDWFAGGSKEVKRTYASIWPQVERKVEAMTMLQVMCDDMRLFIEQNEQDAPRSSHVSCAAAGVVAGAGAGVGCGDLWNEVVGAEWEEGRVRKGREMLELKRRKWGDLCANLESFRQVSCALSRITYTHTYIHTYLHTSCFL
jgi:hypothetical protein